MTWQNLEQLITQKWYFRQREAYKSFGEARVKRWVRQQLVHPTRNGAEKRSKILYSRAELLTIEKTEKIDTYINKL